MSAAGPASRWRLGRLGGELAVLLAIAAGVAGVVAAVHPQRTAVREAAEIERDLTPAEARALATPPVWVDVRPPLAPGSGPVAGGDATRLAEEQRQRGLPPGTLPLPEADFEARIEAVLAAWTGESLIILADADARGTSARVVAGRLRREFGLEEVRILRGGWQAWTQPAQ